MAEVSPAGGGIVGGNEPGLPMREKYTRRPHPDEGPNGAQAEWFGKRVELCTEINVQNEGHK